MISVFYVTTALLESIGLNLHHCSFRTLVYKPFISGAADKNSFFSFFSFLLKFGSDITQTMSGIREVILKKDAYF